MRPTGEAAAHPVCVSRLAPRPWEQGEVGLAERMGSAGQTFLAGIKAAFPPPLATQHSCHQSRRLPGPTASLYIAFGNSGKNRKNNKHVISKIGKEHKVESAGGNES